MLSELLFSVPVMVLFWQENGLSLTEIMILQSIFSLTVVILEVPTGYFADIFGRRKSLVYASFFSFFGYIIYGLGYNFSQFLIAEIFLAFAISLISGANSAMLYDTLKDLKKEKLYKKIWGNILFYAFLSIALACVIGGFVGKINLRWTIYMTLPFMFFLIPLSMSFKEPQRHKLIFKKGYFVDILKIIKTVILIFLTGTSYLLMSNFVYLFSFSFVFLQQFVRGFSTPIIEDYINKLTSSEIRATVLSIKNMSQRFFYAMIIPIIGWIADVYSLTQALEIIGVMTFIVGSFSILMLRRVKVI